MPSKSRKHSRKTIKTRKQRGGLAQQQTQEGGSWLSGLTDKVKSLFSIDSRSQTAQQQEPTEQQAQQAVAKIHVPPPEHVKPQPGWSNIPLATTPRKRKNSLNNWNIIGQNNLLPNGKPI